MANRLANRKRGGVSRRERDAKQRDVHSKIEGMPSGTHSNHHHNLKGTSVTAIIASDAVFFSGSDVRETSEDYLIPRMSLSDRQMLAFGSQPIETETRKAKQLDLSKYNGKATSVDQVKDLMLETSDQRLVWKGDRTLLRRNNPFADAEGERGRGYKREGSITVGQNTRKYTQSIPNPAPVEEQIIGNDVSQFAPHFEPVTMSDDDIDTAFRKMAEENANVKTK